MASASKTRNIDVKIFVIANIEEREKYGITYVFCKNEVLLMTFPPKFFDVLKTNNYYLCRGVVIGETVRLYESSRVSFYFHNVYLAARGVPCIFISEKKKVNA